MKVLQVNKLYYPWIGGIEKVVRQIAEGLNKKDGFEIEVLCCQPQGERKEEIINGVKVNRASSLGIFWGMPFSFSFLSLFRKLSKKFDLIDFHHPFPLGDLAIFLFSPKAKLVVHYHSDIVRQKFFNFLINPFVSHTLKKAKKIIVSNPNLIKTSPYLKKFQEKCEVIPFGVDLKKFEKPGLEEIQKLKKKYGEFVLFLGRLNYYKGLEYLIEAMKEIEANLVIIGEGKEAKNLKHKVRELNLKNKVFFLPHQPRKTLIDFFWASEVLVLPSIFRSEAFGIVLIEAMACGRPVISTELGTGTSFVNQERVTGFVVPPRDSKALSLAIQKILGDKNLAQQLGQNAKNRAREKFSLEKMLERTAKIYSQFD